MPMPVIMMGSIALDRTRFVAEAVHFDGSTRLVNAALASVDGPQAAFSLFFRTDDGDGWPAFVVAPAESFLQAAVLSATEGPHAVAGFGVDINNFAATSGTPFSPGSWHHFLASADASSDPFVMAAYLDDVLCPEDVIITGAPIGTLPFNGLPLAVGTDLSFPGGVIGDLAEMWIAPGVSLLDEGGNVPEATRRKFISPRGKPVYLGAHGELPTGIRPAVFLSGNASRFGVNRGTGGDFGRTGTLTTAVGP